MKCSTKISILCFIIFNSIQLFAQEKSYVQDSLEVMELTKGLGTYYTDIDLYKVNFAKAIEVIDQRILPKKASRFFTLRKAHIRDRQAVILKIEEKYDEALALLLNNITYKEDIQEYKTLAGTYRMVASIFVWQENYIKAEQYYKTGLKLARQYDNKQEEIENLLSLGRLFATMEDYVTAEKTIDSALAHFETYDAPEQLVRAYASYIIILRQQKQFEKAIFYNKKNIETHIKLEDSLSLGFAYFNLGLTYNDSEKYDLAIETFKKSLLIEGDSVSPGRIKSRYQALSDSYIAKKDFKSGHYYLTKYLEANENEGNIQEYKKTIELESQFKYERKKVLDSLHSVQEKKEIEYDIKRKANNRFWMVVSSLLILVACLWLLYYKRKQKVMTTQLKNKLLHSEIESRKRDLSEFALSLTHDKQWTKSLQKQFEKFKNAKEVDKLQEMDLLEKEILQKVNFDDINKELNKRLDGLSNTFYDNLKSKFPELTKNEIRLCTLIKLKIETPEIANLQNISLASVNTSRYRLRKKLNLSKGINLDEFIDKFI